ncbi:uncharacterized protein LOC130190376 isoform X5 [Pseudoliparis swirei]|uniref:uncharacterized protein LOC130190376 isoform X5 n=1 Tax=Pseudoliparis swirei TaxID=2059687 RepID=UPI0024BE5335|nr:uncharacterized protein LOC130190376 isoform X5 [Pseudoliparis swirei]
MALISKPRSKSIVWLYFGLKADDKGQALNSGEAVCRLCRKIVLAKGGNTTNLRSHLRRRHRADFFENISSTTSGASFEAQAGLDLNHDEFFEDAPFLQTASNTNYVPDAVLPPGEPWRRGGGGGGGGGPSSRAALSLPSCLFLSGSSGEEQTGEMKVHAKCHLQEGVMFGPYVGEVRRGQMPSNLKYAWAIRDDHAFNYVDASDESKSNWMRYVTYTSTEEAHNLVVFQFYRHIYYKVSRPIPEGAELRVWIGRDYATLLGLGMGDNVKCELGDKETVLRLLQDVQLVTLAEPSSSYLWSDRSQSPSPMLVIGDVTTMSNPDTASESGAGAAAAIGSAFPSSSTVSLPSPSSHPCEKYDFMPGTERLLSNPNAAAAHSSPWHFFGLEPDPAGRPLDRRTAVCKLCGERVGCGGGASALQNHLTGKHHIRPPRDGVKDRSFTAIGHPRSQPAAGPGGPVSPLPAALSAPVADAIADFLVADVQPPALADGDGFRRLLRALRPSCEEPPSPWQLEDLLRERHARGKASLARLLGSKMASGGGVSDHTAPVEFEPRRRGRPRKEVPHFVTLSADVWTHNWRGGAERHVTLWVHYVDAAFSFHNLALATRRLTEGGGVEDGGGGGLGAAAAAQAKRMAQEWGIATPNAVLLGGDVRDETAGGEAGAPLPNSTTSPERPGEGLPPVPCFFAAVRGCVEEAMSHPVVSETLGRFRDVLAALFAAPAPSSPRRRRRARSPLRGLKRRERAELKAWAHGGVPWSRLYPLLSALVEHKSLLCAALGELESESSSKEDEGSESGSSGGRRRANSASSPATTFATLRSEWKVAEELRLVLRPLDVACRTLAKEAFPRLTLVKPILTGLLSRHLAPRPGDSSSALKEVKREMRRSLASRYEDPAVNRVLCVACSLDPQFHGLGFMEEKEQKATFDWLKEEAVRIVKEDRRRGRGHTASKRSGSPESDGDFLRRSKRLKESRPIDFREAADEESDAAAEEEEEEEADEGESADPPQGGLSGMEFLLGDLFCSAPRSKRRSVEEAVEAELSVFRAGEGAALGVEPLQWWRSKAAQFPLLATAARAYLAAPAAAGSAARDFAREAAAAAACGKRANIPPESLDVILFLHHNHTHAAESARNAGRKEDDGEEEDGGV